MATISISLTRRSLLKSALGTGSGLIVGSVLGMDAAFAQTASLPGAAQGLTAKSLKDFQPFAPSTEARARPPMPRRVGFVAPTITEYMSSLSDACKSACKSRGGGFAYEFS